jgi:hypothetical protein
MIELDERYVDVIVARWQNLTGQEGHPRVGRPIGSRNT